MQETKITIGSIYTKVNYFCKCRLKCIEITLISSVKPNASLIFDLNLKVITAQQSLLVKVDKR